MINFYKLKNKMNKEQIKRIIQEKKKKQKILLIQLKRKIMK